MQINARLVEQESSTLAAIFSLAFTAGLFCLYFVKTPVDTTILASHVQALKLQSTRPQFYFYLVLLSSVVTLCLRMLLRPQIKFFWAGRNSTSELLAILVITIAIVLGSRDDPYFIVGLLFVAGLIVLRSQVWRTPSVLRHLTRLERSRRLISATLMVISFCFFGIFFILPITRSILIHDLGQWISMQTHYALVMLPGFDLAHGNGIIRSDYGVGVPLLTAGMLNLVSSFGFSAPTLVRVVQLFQMVAVALMCTLSVLLDKRSSVLLITLALGLTAGNVSNFSAAVIYPNQSGIRFIVFLVSLIVLVIETRRQHPRIWLLASTAAIFALLSPETGAAAIAAYGMSILLIAYDRNAPASSIGQTLLWTSLCFAITAVVGLALILRLVFVGSPMDLLRFVIAFAGGYGGKVEKPNTAAVLLFFIATAAVLRGVLRAQNSILRWKDIYQASIGASILIWLIYYINRMDQWNLWFNVVLFVAMIGPQLRYGVRYALRPHVFGGATQAAIACFIGGQLLYSTALATRDALRWIRADWASCVFLNGVCLQNGNRSTLLANLRTLSLRDDFTHTVVLSAASTEVRLMGFNREFPWYEPFGEVIRQSDVDTLVNWIGKSRIEHVIVDSPGSAIALAAPLRQQHFQKIVAQLKSYREVDSDSAWTTLDRIHDH